MNLSIPQKDIYINVVLGNQIKQDERDEFFFSWTLKEDGKISFMTKKTTWKRGVYLCLYYKVFSE